MQPEHCLAPLNTGYPMSHPFADGGCDFRVLACKEIIMNYDKELDARGLNCPLPILRTKKSLNELTTGQVLKVSATDPGAVKDIQAFTKQTGNELVSSAAANGEYIFMIRKG